MKIEKDKSFRPVTITLETEEDVDNFSDAMGLAAGRLKYNKHCSKGREFAKKMYDAINDLD